MSGSFDTSPSRIKELNTDLAVGIKEIMDLCDDLSSQLNALSGTFQDEGYSVVQSYISKTQKQVYDALPDLKVVIGKLTELAELLQQSRASIQ